MAAIEVRTPEDFEREVLAAKAPTVVAFWASWCPFCRAFRPPFDAAAARSDGRFAVARLDDYDNPLWDRYHVNVVPTLALFHGGELVARKDGVLGKGLSREDLAAFLRAVEASAPARSFLHR